MLTSDEVLAGVLNLPEEERARIAHGLLLSLDGEEEVAGIDEAWAGEIRRRLAEIRSGRVGLLDWSTVRSEIQRELDARREP